MIKKNSIFLRILIPVVIVMLMQTLLISFVLIINGTIKSLEDSAVESLKKNVDNRSITLENMMVDNWSNLEKLEGDIVAAIDAYLALSGVTIDDVLASGQFETDILFQVSDALINALRLSSSTGVFMYFVEDPSYMETIRSFRGLYYRDYDPVLTPADYADIQYLRGFVDIARKDQIQLDSFWSEKFTFSPANKRLWNGFISPLKAAIANPELSPADLSYWSEPHFINAASDANECITYTRPLLYKGRLVGMIGTEMQVDQLRRYFPANDFDSSGKSGYMLIKYSAEDAASGQLDCGLYAVTGSYIRRLLGTAERATLVQTGRERVYTISAGDIEGVQIAIQPLRLYNVNAPFSGEQWALASVGADSVLFGQSRSVNRGIFISTAAALVVGVALLAFLVRMSTKPLISIAGQIASSEPGDPIVVSSSNTYEIALLCSTLNTMREKRRLVEAELREERERYLFALESATDTFLEYDVTADSFMLYYFSDDNQQSTLKSGTTHAFLDKIRAGEICHENDIQNMLLFFTARVTEPIEARFKASLAPHLTGSATDGDYFWFLFKASHILGDSGGVVKIIGIAREITGEKLLEQARLEAARRDITTGLYNAEYGDMLMKQSVYAATASFRPFAVLVVHADDFGMFEAYYGRVFAAVVLMKLSREITAMTSERDIAVRVDNDDIMLFLDGVGRRETQAFVRALQARLDLLYVGENSDILLTVSAGAALSSDASDYMELRENARAAARHASRAGHDMSFYSELSTEARTEKPVYKEPSVSVSLDISRDGMVPFAFDLFEHSPDIRSSINILIDVLGGAFALSQVVVCMYDADFDANHVAYQWSAEPGKLYKTGIERISRGDFESLEALLDINGTLVCTGADAAEYSVGVQHLLCVSPGERASVYCCAMFENGVHVGRVLFKSGDPQQEWSGADAHSLYEITKIISANISIDKSNSASRAKSEFLSRMSHEIRTPMNAIIGMTGIAKESVRNTERLEDCLAKIDFSAKHLLSLINDVLEMSRIESGKLTIGSAPFSLDQFAESIDTLMRPQLDAKGVTFVINRSFTRGSVIGDEYRLRQVLVNLIGNAGKFTEAGGTVTFSIDEQEPSSDELGVYRLSVRDTGVGISREDQPNIFRAFEQAKEGGSAKKNKEGTGLGLAISSNIISAMGSKIELISDVGVGSEFYFTIKLALGGEQDTAAAQSSDTGGDHAQHLTGKHILLVEDNEINTEIATYLLEDVGIKVEVATNGQEALDKFFASTVGFYDAVLMDIQMPVMDGLTATRSIRKNVGRADARTVPIIAMTANAFDEDMKKSIESGMNGHIAKPIDNDKLYSLLRQLIES